MYDLYLSTFVGPDFGVVSKEILSLSETIGSGWI